MNVSGVWMLRNDLRTLRREVFVRNIYLEWMEIEIRHRRPTPVFLTYCQTAGFCRTIRGRMENLKQPFSDIKHSKESQ